MHADLQAHFLGDRGLALSEAVATYLREQIISGELKRGEFVRIEAIGKALKVSTTPVREGLLLLQNESFVRLIPRRGFMVNSFSKDDIYDVFWAQAMVGAELAARAATKISDEDMTRLEEFQAAHVKANAEGDELVSSRAGYQFHRTINLAAQSPRLALMMGSLARQVPSHFVATITGRQEETTEYHQIIIGAIRVRDPEAVRSLMYRHFVSSAEHVIATLEARGIWGKPSEGSETPGAKASGPLLAGPPGESPVAADGVNVTDTKPVQRRPGPRHRSGSEDALPSAMSSASD